MGFRKLRAFVSIACAAVVLSLSGCNAIWGIFNPLIGTWSQSTTTNSVTDVVTFTFNYDDSWSMTSTTNGVLYASGSGTYTQDQSAKTLDLEGTSTTSGSTTTVSETISYSINGNQLTLGNMVLAKQ